jgi:hypothetical protein
MGLTQGLNLKNCSVSEASIGFNLVEITRFAEVNKKAKERQSMLVR